MKREELGLNDPLLVRYADTLSTWYRETWEHPIRMT